MKSFIRHFLFLITGFASCGLFAEAESLALKFSEMAQEIDKTIEDSMAALGVPGAAVGIVIGDQVVLSKGYGLRDIEHFAPVSNDTIFPVGSISKSITSMMIGTLVDEGIVSWEDPIAEYIPYFRLKDPYTTYEITFRDYLLHISGYPKHDGAWFGLDCNRAEVISRIKHLEPLFPFREGFFYQNMGYMIVGEAAECHLQTPFEDLVKQRVFNPLGMNRTHYSIPMLQLDQNRATGYRQSQNEVLRCEYMDVSLINAAGGVNSSLEDMIKYLQCVLNDGEDLLSRHTFKEITSPHVITNLLTNDMLDLTQEIMIESYGLGWFVISYKGELMVIHGGNVEGFSSVIAFFPRHNMGLVVLSNKHMNPFPYMVSTILSDQLLDLPKTNWIKKCLEMTNYALYDIQRNENDPHEHRHKNTQFSHHLHDYEGDYFDPGYGDISIRAEGDQLTCFYRGIAMPLSHWHYDVFEISDSCPTHFLRGMKVQFIENVEGEISTVRIPFEPMVRDICFEKQQRTRSIQIDPLARYVGDYTYHGFSFVITEEEGHLVVSAMGQPPFDLVHQKDHQFTIIDFDGYTVIFDMDEEGLAEQVNLIQPTGMVFTATRI